MSTDPTARTPVICPVGDSAANVEFGTEISDAINDRVYEFVERVLRTDWSWLREVVPTYRSLLVFYDGFEVDYSAVESELLKLVDAAAGAGTAGQDRVTRVYELPTAYGGEYGPDVAHVAEHAGLSESEVIELHSSVAYRVYMIGFSPGFPYLGGMSPRIATPRLATPRTRVPAGSVGIAETQTGVYPTASPGGWQLIGRTPVGLFDAATDPPSLLQPGHFVKFVPVDPVQFAEVEAAVEAGEYSMQVSGQSE